MLIFFKITKLQSSSNANGRSLTDSIIDHLRDIPMESQTTDITHFAVVFHHNAAMKALKTLRSTTNYMYLDVIMKNNGKVCDVCSLACRMKVLNGCPTNLKMDFCYVIPFTLQTRGPPLSPSHASVVPFSVLAQTMFSVMWKGHILLHCWGLSIPTLAPFNIFG